MQNECFTFIRSNAFNEHEIPSFVNGVAHYSQGGKPTFPQGKLSGFNAADVQNTDGSGSVLRLQFSSQGSHEHAAYRMKSPFCLVQKGDFKFYTESIHRRAKKRFEKFIPKWKCASPGIIQAEGVCRGADYPI